MNELFVTKNEDNIVIAVKEKGKLVEVVVEDFNKVSIVGNIYKAKVQHLSSGIQAAFLDIGEKKKALLPLNTPDGRIKFELISDIDEEVHQEMIIKAGDEILVQVVRDEINEKGAKLTSFISIAGNFLVLLPNVHFVGVSKQIRDRDFKSSIKSMLYSTIEPNVGVIVRTAALDATHAIIKREYFELLKIWKRISANIDKSISPTLLYKETTVSKKLIRDLMKKGIEHIYVDSKEIYHDILEYFSYIGINMKKKVHLFQFKIPILAYYEIDRELEKMFKPEVYLKGGASIVIETTEALTAIDVNSGKISRSRDNDSLIKDINIMAAEEIARQLRLRDIGGIIVIDFIDMSDELSKKELLSQLKKHLKNDRSTTKTLKVSQFGLVEMTRKKIGPSVIHYFINKCDCCDGRGYTPKPFYIGLKFVRWLKENGKNYSDDTLIVNAQENVVNSIRKNLMRYIETVMKENRMNVKIQVSDSIKNGICEIYSVNKVERVATVN